MKKIIGAAALVAGLALLPAAHAAELRGGEEVTVRNTETVTDNLYAAGGNAVMSGTVAGDLLTAGGNVLINGSVGQDIFAAGGNINLTGQAGGDIRAAGGTIVLSGSAAGDFVAAGGQIHLVSGSTVNGDVVAAGGRIVVDGTVIGDLRLVGGEVIVNGAIGGNVILEADQVRLGDSAVIAGDLRYKSPRAADIHSAAQIGGTVDFERRAASMDARRTLAAFFGFWMLARLLMLFAAVGALFLISRKFVQGTTQEGVDSFFASLLHGFIFLIVVPVAGIILLVTVIGLPLGFLVLLVYAMALILSWIFASLVFGYWLERYLFKQPAAQVSGRTAVLGVMLFWVVGFIPIIGWIVRLVFFLAALGALTRITQGHLRLHR